MFKTCASKLHYWPSQYRVFCRSLPKRQFLQCFKFEKKNHFCNSFVKNKRVPKAVGTVLENVSEWIKYLVFD
jgi:hypothetical protein